MSEQNSWSSIPQSIRDQLRELVFERDGYVCTIRGKKCTGVAEELDHIIPRSQGGAVLDVENCRSSCSVCNRGRRDGTGGNPKRPPKDHPSLYSGRHTENGPDCRCGQGYPWPTAHH